MRFWALILLPSPKPPCIACEAHALGRNQGGSLVFCFCFFFYQFGSAKENRTKLEKMKRRDSRTSPGTDAEPTHTHTAEQSTCAGMASSTSRINCCRRVPPFGDSSKRRVRMAGIKIRRASQTTCLVPVGPTWWQSKAIVFHDQPKPANSCFRRTPHQKQCEPQAKSKVHVDQLSPSWPYLSLR